MPDRVLEAMSAACLAAQFTCDPMMWEKFVTWCEEKGYLLPGEEMSREDMAAASAQIRMTIREIEIALINARIRASLAEMQGLFPYHFLMSWEDHAACAGMDLNLFFPEGGEKNRVRQAMQACRRCPVRQECLQYAIDHNEWGIWGGMDTAERRSYAKSHDLI